MYDETGLHRFGTSLPEFDEDTVPSKKPVRPEDQIVTDENGKRRFHGAFTGGFSAGYWNTVGSQEGWTPATFKSSRGEKAASRIQQRPDDFMDDEDRGEFGIAPQRLQPRADYTSFEPNQSRKRKLMASEIGPIPGKPVLEKLLLARNVKIGERILKSMGWRPGQGIGPRQTRKEKKAAHSRNRREMYVMQQYGYQPESSIIKSPGYSDDADEEVDSSSSDCVYDIITYAPDDYEPYVCQPKLNRFGLAYKGSLCRDTDIEVERPAGGHINLFQPTLEAIRKNDKKVSIQGQAFGVGALEDEDEDIYARDDLSKYDFSLEDCKPTKKPAICVQDRLIITGFVACKYPTGFRKSENPDIPANYIPRNWAQRRSRFQPMDSKRAEELELSFRKYNIARSCLNPDERAELLNEMQMLNEPLHKNFQKLEQLQHTGSLGGAKHMVECLEREEHLISNANKSKNWDSGQSKNDDSIGMLFKPFLHDAQKQSRYEEFMRAEVKSEDEITHFLNRIQPVHLSEWDRQMEKKEFIQASKIFKPLNGLMSQRFVSESNIQAERCKTELLTTGKERSIPKKVTIKRSKSKWKPHSLLCKRYNIAEPYSVDMAAHKGPPISAKMSVFTYVEDCLNKKSDFGRPMKSTLECEEQKKHSLKKGAEPSPSTSFSSIDSCNQSSSSAASVIVIDKLHCMGSKPFKDSCTQSTKEEVQHAKVGRPTAKTDLEKRAEKSKSEPVCDKVELYKAIFDDSSDEDGNNQYAVTVIGKQGSPNPADSGCTKAALMESSADKFNYTEANASADNIFWNMSPPRGIFSALLGVRNKEQTAKKQDNANTCMDISINTTCVKLTDMEALSDTANQTGLKDKLISTNPPKSTDYSKSAINLLKASNDYGKNSGQDKIETVQLSNSKPFIEKEPNQSNVKVVIKEDTGKIPNHIRVKDISTSIVSSKSSEYIKHTPVPHKNANRLPGAGTSQNFSSITEVPSTSFGSCGEVYGPELPKQILVLDKLTVAHPSNAHSDGRDINKSVEEPKIPFLDQCGKSVNEDRNEEWVEKKIRSILKTKIECNRSSSSGVHGKSSVSGTDRKQKKKSKKNKSHKKSKKKSKDKKNKKPIEKKNKC